MYITCNIIKVNVLTQAYQHWAVFFQMLLNKWLMVHGCFYLHLKMINDAE